MISKIRQRRTVDVVVGDQTAPKTDDRIILQLNSVRYVQQAIAHDPNVRSYLQICKITARPMNRDARIYFRIRANMRPIPSQGRQRITESSEGVRHALDPEQPIYEFEPNNLK